MSRIAKLPALMRRQFWHRERRLVIELHDRPGDVAVVIREHRKRRGREMLVSDLLELAAPQLAPGRAPDRSQLGLFDGAAEGSCPQSETS